jgi:hypothetical protein
MANQQWVSLLTPSTPQAAGAGTALTTATTATVSPVRGDGGDVAQVNAEGQYLGWYTGMIVRLTARGFITTTATSTTATFLVASRVGNTGSTYVTLATSAGLATGTGAVTGIQWKLEGLVRCTAVATSGSTLSTQCDMHFYNPAAQTIGTTAWGIDLCLPNASGETAATVDTTQMQGLSMRATLAGANATIQLTQWIAETLN